MLTDKQTVMTSFRNEADGYIVKPYTPGSVMRDLLRENLIGAV
jgi:hypothetical protein